MYFNNFKEYRTEYIKWYLALLLLFWNMLTEVVCSALMSFSCTNDSRGYKLSITKHKMYLCFDICFCVFFYIDIIFFNKHSNIFEMLKDMESYCALASPWEREREREREQNL